MQEELKIVVQDMSGVDVLRPVTGGVPLAEGAAPEGTRFTLRDGQGQRVPLQTFVLARWRDGSVRWVLLDFQARPPASGKTSFTLSWGKDIASPIRSKRSKSLRSNVSSNPGRSSSA